MCVCVCEQGITVKPASNRTADKTKFRMRNFNCKVFTLKVLRASQKGFNEKSSAAGQKARSYISAAAVQSLIEDRRCEI